MEKNGRSNALPNPHGKSDFFEKIRIFQIVGAPQLYLFAIPYTNLSTLRFPGLLHPTPHTPISFAPNMPAVLTSRFSVSDVNTVVAVLSVCARYIMAFIIAKVVLDVRRMMILKGQGHAVIQDAGYLSEISDIPKLYKVCRRSMTKSMTALACAPIFIGIMLSLLLEFTTSGVSSTIVQVQDQKISLLGLVGDENQSGSIPTIENLRSNLETEIDVYLLAPNLGSMGLTSSSGSLAVSKFSVGTTTSIDLEDGFHFDDLAYTIGNVVTLGYCVEFDFEYNSLVPCRENLFVDKFYREFGLSYESLSVLDEELSCTTKYSNIPLGPKYFTALERELTLTDWTDDFVVSATCVQDEQDALAEICVWVDLESDILWLGRWLPQDVCFEDGEIPYPTRVMGTIQLSYTPPYGLDSLEVGSDASVLLATQIFEELAVYDAGDTTSILSGIFAALLRIESLTWGEVVAYTSKNEEIVSVEYWVVVLLVSVIVIPLGTLLSTKRLGLGGSFFLPVSIEEWNACVARDLDKSVPHVLEDKPGEEYSDFVYALKKESGHAGGVRLGWVKKDEAVPQVVEL